MQPHSMSRPGAFRAFSAAAAAILAFALLLFAPSAGFALTVIQGGGQTYVAFEAERTPALVNGTPPFWAERAEAAASGGRALIADGPNSTGNSPHSFAQYSIRFA
ncbi:MAG TPA: hypothetical protein PKE47_15300, partial [Verrucomicrobiota bacterium]|nr:hypothetical protein [Verrucomicrobiota bacterium]